MLKMILLFYRPKEITLEPTHMSFWTNRETSSTQTGPGTEGTFPPPPTRPDLTALAHVCGGDGTLRVKGRGRGLYPPPHNRLYLISTIEYPGLCQIYIISAILLFHEEVVEFFKHDWI